MPEKSQKKAKRAKREGLIKKIAKKVTEKEKKVKKEKIPLKKVTEKEKKVEEKPKKMEKKPEEKPKEVVEEKPVLERVYTIPLRKAKRGPRTRRANKAIRVIREFLIRHMKAREVKLGKNLNEKIWERGRQKIPPRVRVKATKDKEDVVSAELV
jgi:large subunit ribosomal protein L31e